MYSIELDLHLLKDNQVVVFHDDHLKRMTGVDKKVKDCTYQEIKELKLANTSESIPLFEEVLNLVKGEVPLLIELKYDRMVGKLEKEVMKRLVNYPGKYAIQSFNPFSVLYLRMRYKHVIRGQIACDFKQVNMNGLVKFLLKNRCFQFFTKPDFISYAIQDLPNQAIEKFRKKGVVLGWTVRNKEELRKAKKYCDNAICENLEDMKETKNRGIL